MNDPLENDLKKMKAHVPVPQDFLARVRRQIALDEVPVDKPQRISWWPGWSDFLSQNPFAVASALALCIFAISSVIWWAGKESPDGSAKPAALVALQKEPAQNLQKALPSSSHLAESNIKQSQMAKLEDSMNPDDVIVTIHLSQNENDRFSSESPVTPAQEGLTTGLDLEGVKPELSAVVPPQIPVFQSKVSGPDTIKIVEQLAQKYSSALVEGKLAERRKDLKTDNNPLKTLTIEIDPAKKDAFLAALSNSFITVTTLSADSAQQTVKPAEGNATAANQDTVQIKIKIASPSANGSPP